MELKPYIPEVGETVAWLWYGKPVHGVVQEILPKTSQIVSKGKAITRNGSPSNPAIMLSHKSGNDVIKLASELVQPN